MDSQFFAGLGVSIVFWLLTYAFKDMPPAITWGGIAFGIVLMAWHSIPIGPKYNGPLAIAAVVFVLAVSAGAWTVSLWSVPDGGTEVTDKTPNIALLKIGYFWVEVDNGIYQLAAVTKFFNFDSTSHAIDGIAFSKNDMILVPRGGYQWTGAFLENLDHAALREDNFIKAGSEQYFKMLLPIKIQMKILGGETQEPVIFGKWELLIGKKKLSVEPQVYAAYGPPISQQEWDDLLRPASKINAENLHYKDMPPPPQGGPYKYYLIYNPDRSASIDVFWVDKTQSIKGADGVMMFIGCRGTPPLGSGWTILGQTYNQVWADPKKLAVYNSLYPPGLDGKPKPFGVFAGADEEMMGKPSMPTQKDNPSVSVTNSPGSIIAPSGGKNSITNNFGPPPPPKPLLKLVSENETDHADGSHTLIRTVEMNAPYSGSLTVSIKAAGLRNASISSLTVTRIPGTTLMTSGGGVQHNVVQGDGFYSTTIPTPSGQYAITVLTDNKAKVVIVTSFQ